MCDSCVDDETMVYIHSLVNITEEGWHQAGIVLACYLYHNVIYSQQIPTHSYIYNIYIKCRNLSNNINKRRDSIPIENCQKAEDHIEKQNTFVASYVCLRKENIG